MGLLIYVFKEEDKERLISLGYKMLREDNIKHIYIFASKEDRRSDLEGIEFVYSNTLSF